MPSRQSRLDRLVLWDLRCCACGTSYCAATALDEDPDTMDPVPACPDCGGEFFDYSRASELTRVEFEGMTK